MRTRRYRLMVDFQSLNDLRAFAAAMEDRTLLPEDAVVREADVLDDRGGGIAKFIWARDREAAPGEQVYPELDAKWERHALEARLAALEK